MVMVVIESLMVMMVVMVVIVACLDGDCGYGGDVLIVSFVVDMMMVMMVNGQ